MGPERNADALEQLLRLAGPRPEASAERQEQARAAVEAEWISVVRQRRSRRLRWRLAAAAGLVVAVAGGTLLLQRSVVGPDVVLAQVIGVTAGGATADGAAPLEVGDSLVAGSAIATGGGRVALRLADGQELRLDRDTRLALRSTGRVALERGALYFDSGLEGPPERIEVWTPLGTLYDIGTRYAALVEPGSLRVRVRDGHVRIGAARASHEAEAGTETSLDASGRIARSRFPGHGPAWDWTLDVAPMPEIEGRPLREFLEWAAREGGWQLAYDDRGTPARAAGIRLSGSIADHTLIEALDAVLPTSGLGYRVEGDVLIVTAGGDSGG